MEIQMTQQMAAGGPTASGATTQATRRDSLRNRITLWVGAMMSSLLLLMVLTSAIFARRQVLQDASRQIHGDAQDSAQRIEQTLRMVAVNCASLADAATNAGLSPEQLTAVVRAVVKATPDAIGSMLILEPTQPGAKPFARYVAADGKVRDFAAENYDYKAKPWYQRTLAAPAGWWSDPHFDKTAGNLWAITYDLPIRRNGRFVGMVGLSIPLDSMRNHLEPLLARLGWRTRVVGPDGLVAISSEPGMALNYHFDDYLRAQHRTDLAAAAQAVRLHKPLAYGHTDPRDGTQLLTVIAPIGNTGGSLMLSETHSQILSRVYKTLALVLAVGLFAALLCTLAVRWLASRISRPLEDLANSATHLANGDYAWPVPHDERGDEIGHLARTLDDARNSIQRQLSEIREMTIAQQKLDSELSMARDIQLSMVPPPRRFAREGGLALDAYAVLEPAKEVGGDFYGYHERDGVLWFAIGDVSDKGLPAALFMARSYAILKTASDGVDTPGQTLAVASRLLAQGNDTCMFVTALIGRIDLRTGACMLASAGHDAPLFLHADGHVEQLQFDNGPALGFDACDDYPLWQGRLQPGDSLVAWTDGITEAFNADDLAFGEERLLAATRPSYSARENCTQLVAAVRAFAAGAAQSDDITVLAIHAQSTTDST